MGMYKIWVRIKGKDFPATFGAPIDDNLTETLDSMTVMITHDKGFEALDIKPFDDAIVHSTEIWTGPDGLDSDGKTMRHEGEECVWCPNNHGFQKIYKNKIVPVWGEAESGYVPDDKIDNAHKMYVREEYVELANYLGVDLKGMIDEDSLIADEITEFNPHIKVSYLFKYHIGKKTGVGFYRHMLINSPSSKQLTFSDYKQIFNTLVSETKGLEFTPMPNRAITQPTVDDIKVVDEPTGDDAEVVVEPIKGKTIWYWMNSYLESYCPRIKKLKEGTDDEWEYVKKYRLADENDGAEYDLKAKFGNTVCPEMTFGGATLRSAFTQLMNVLNCIPVVKDGVITYLDTSARKKSFAERREQMRAYMIDSQEYPDIHNNDDIKELMPSFAEHEGRDDIPNYSWKQEMMSGEEYADRLRTDYSGGISRYNTTKMVEKIGFRNTSVSSMNFTDLRLETTFPIYKVKKVYIEWYKKLGGATNKAFLAKYDITDLVKLNSERSMLSHDYYDFIKNSDLKKYQETKDIKEFAKYYFFTVGYDIGSKYITGWGETLNFSRDGILNSAHSTLENIMVICEIIGYYGDWGADDIQMFSDSMDNNEYINIAPNYSDDYGVSKIDWGEENGNTEAVFDNMISNATETNDSKSVANLLLEIKKWKSDVFKNLFGVPYVTDYTQKMKSVFFEVEYEAMIDGAIITSKDYHDGTIERIDNQNSALPVIETAGLFEKEKANKLGNATVIVSQRVRDTHFIMQIGDYDQNDMIIYKRTIAFQRDYMNVTYYLCKDFVLKNLYVSVSSRIRPFALSSYGDATKRNENHYQTALLSHDRSYYQTSDSMQAFENGGFKPSDALSFMIPNSAGVYPYSYRTDKLFAMKSKEGEEYIVEGQVFSHGRSLCVEFNMPDSVSAGTKILNWNPSVARYINEKFGIDAKIDNWYGDLDDIGKAMVKGEKDFLNDLTGVVQDWNMIQSNVEPIDVQFDLHSLSKDNKSKVFGDYKTELTIKDNGCDVLDEKNESIYEKLMNLPKNPYSFSSSDMVIIDKDKDQKEKINSIAQLEIIDEISKGLYVSSWAAILSERSGVKFKNWANYGTSEPVLWLGKATVCFKTDSATSTSLREDRAAFPMLISIMTNSQEIKELIKGETIVFPSVYFKWGKHDDNEPDNEYANITSYMVEVYSAKFDSNGNLSQIKVKFYENDWSLLPEGESEWIDMSNGSLSVGDEIETTYLAGHRFGIEGGFSSIKTPKFLSDYDYPLRSKKLWPDNYLGSKFLVGQAKTNSLWKPVSPFISYPESGDSGIKEITEIIKQDELGNGTPVYITGENDTCEDLFNQWIDVAGNPGAISPDWRPKLGNVYKSSGYVQFKEAYRQEGVVNLGTLANLFIYHDPTKIDSKIMEFEAFNGEPQGTRLANPLFINDIDVAEGGYRFNSEGIAESTIANSIDGCGYADITMPDIPSTIVEGEGSIRLYYKDTEGDGLYHLVLATNNFHIEDVIKGDVKVPTLKIRIYSSVLEDRSKTVIDGAGEGKYEIVNYATDAGARWGVANKCKPKS